MKDAPSVLFLHGGPGFDCEGERRWFADTLPVVWWDQPRHAGQSGSWTDLAVAKATEKVSQMSREQGRAIAIVAHSYGCLMAQRVADAAPDEVGELVLLGPGVSLATQFLRMGRHLLSRHPGVEGDDMRTAVAVASSDPGPQAVFAIAGAASALPGWRRMYFSPASRGACERYEAMLPEGAPIDLPTFVAGVTEHFADPPVAAPARFSGPVRIVIGSDDVLLDRDDVMPYWSIVYPQARVEQASVGHMAHMEMVHAGWMPRLAAA